VRVNIEEIRGPTRNHLYGRREKEEEKETGKKEERRSRLRDRGERNRSRRKGA
jgi:hypothetical protein